MDLCTGAYRDLYDEVFVIDCRFSYEYEGGHVKGALNMPSEEDLKRFFVKNAIVDKKIAIVFYCEFSSKRGPTGYRNLRKMDRECNVYPKLYYPDVFLLEGGYSKFFAARPVRIIWFSL